MLLKNQELMLWFSCDGIGNRIIHVIRGRISNLPIGQAKEKALHFHTMCMEKVFPIL
jgi:hypothetical protein